jgi:hypothetical protein
VRLDVAFAQCGAQAKVCNGEHRERTREKNPEEQERDAANLTACLGTHQTVTPARSARALSAELRDLPILIDRHDGNGIQLGAREQVLTESRFRERDSVG